MNETFGNGPSCRILSANAMGKKWYEPRGKAVRLRGGTVAREGTKRRPAKDESAAKSAGKNTERSCEKTFESNSMCICVGLEGNTTEAFRSRGKENMCLSYIAQRLLTDLRYDMGHMLRW